MKNMIDSIFFTHKFVTEHKLESHKRNRIRDFLLALTPQKSSVMEDYYVKSVFKNRVAVWKRSYE